ncbi:MAG: DedA family protein [Coxiellaceae bacterium]|nr:DedA family protein [Coxiellaceae bacterium]
MLHYFQPMINYIHQHPNIGALITFLVALAESLPLIGTIIPGSITMTAIGTMIGTGLLPGFSTLAWASFGALVGDTIGFGCGYLFNEKIRKIWPFRKYPHWLELSEKFFEKHGGKSIIVGRFVGPARSTVPLVAGLLKMTWLRFTVAAIPSAVMWALLYMVPGILLGALALELPPHVATEFIVIGLIVIVGLWLVFWALQYFFSQLAHIINVWIDKLWDVLIRHKPSRPFIRLIAVKGKPSDHYQLMLVILALVAGLLFLGIFYSVTHHAWLTQVNAPVFHLLQSLRTKDFDFVFIIITLLGTTLAMFDRKEHTSERVYIT